jgi:8-oxo-dGTP pyrophosphatase MutT (NUDIX family)
MIWTPRTTVAAVIERDNQFLMVEEIVDGKMTLNQPAGHLESGESLIEAIIRETQEETAWQFTPTGLVGIYRWVHEKSGDTYMRFAFHGKLGDHDTSQSLDADIHAAIWLSKDELLNRNNEFRSPLVFDCFNDYINGERYSLQLLHN